ncbi:tRNA-modifying protein YgfZ [Thalassotalea euphylliae]|uniref:tRNA-modifying protein YgfZ n=1 Tax=Thalassotalea euphylliae TaxID=1655234 RepID=UPI00363D13A0
MSLAPNALSHFPENFAITLTDVSAISLHGPEQVKYLQGQVTCDVSLHKENDLTIGAHCDAKGKVLSVFRLISHQEKLLLLQSKASLGSSLPELKKFGVFAKVDIEEATELSVSLLVGTQVTEKLSNSFVTMPSNDAPVAHCDNLTLVKLSVENTYLLVGDSETHKALIASLNLDAADQSAWPLLELATGFPQLSEASVQKYVPQMLNVDKLNGISFTKGCYLGQETVARMEYLGKNKKMMALLTGNVNGELSDLAIEKQLGENWRGAGDVLAHTQTKTGELFVQAVISNDLTTDDVIRVKDNDDIRLTLQTESTTN